MVSPSALDGHSLGGSLQAITPSLPIERSCQLRWPRPLSQNRACAIYACSSSDGQFTGIGKQAAPDPWFRQRKTLQHFIELFPVETVLPAPAVEVAPQFSGCTGQVAACTPSDAAALPDWRNWPPNVLAYCSLASCRCPLRHPSSIAKSIPEAGLHASGETSWLLCSLQGLVPWWLAKFNLKFGSSTNQVDLIKFCIGTASK